MAFYFLHLLDANGSLISTVCDSCCPDARRALQRFSRIQVRRNIIYGSNYSFTQAPVELLMDVYVDTILWFATPRLFKGLNLPEIRQPIAPTVDVVTLPSPFSFTLSLHLYPNPSPTPTLSIETSQPFIEKVALYRLTGERVTEAEFPAPVSEYIWMLPEHLPSGLYLVQVYGEGRTLTLRWSLIRSAIQ